MILQKIRGNQIKHKICDHEDHLTLKYTFDLNDQALKRLIEINKASYCVEIRCQLTRYAKTFQVKDNEEVSIPINQLAEIVIIEVLHNCN